MIYARSKNYRGILRSLSTIDAGFWNRVNTVRERYLEAIQTASAAGYGSTSGWTQAQKQVRYALKNPHVSYFSTELGNPAFCDAFLEAIGDKDFPKHPKPRARFLAESIAGYGEVSARRCRDICSEMRAKEEQKKTSWPELRIKCCGRARWTVDSVCPECGQSPIPMNVF